MYSRLTATIMFALVLAAGPVAWSAESAQNKAPAEANGSSNAPRPHRGMTMKQVEQRYGTPLKKMEPIGKPPITRWFYKDFTVYFETKYVIHAVDNKIQPVTVNNK